MKTLTTYTRNIVAGSLLLLATASCKKEFLEIVPKGKLIAQNTADYNLLLNNLTLINMNSANAQVLLGDEIVAMEPYFSSAVPRVQRLFRWEGVIYDQDENAGEMQTPMQNIYIYNKIINEVMESKDGNEQQKLSLQAEATAGRAWAYFTMINYYGLPYNEATSATDLGFPIVKEADVTETNFKRASVKEVYDFIVNDLVTAIPNLPPVTAHRLRMSKAAAEGLLGKVYVFMHKYNEALPMLNAAITDAATATTPVRVYDYKVEFATGGSFLPIGTSGPANPTVVNDAEHLYGKQATNSWSSSASEIVASAQTAALFTADDLRRNFYSPTTQAGPAYPVPGVLRRRSTSQAKMGVIMPDLYLLRAETKCRLNDLTGAVADVEYIRARRLPAASANIAVPAATATQQLALLKFIIEERIREFAVTGHRWYDMRRLSVDPLFGTKTFTHTLYSNTGTPTYYESTPARLVLQFPSKIVGQNPGFENNP